MATSTRMIGIDHTPSNRPRGRVIEALSRIRAEYNELPGLCLTPAEAQRLVGLEQHECVQLFAALLETGYLRRSIGGFTRS